jgi:hypothetical protein
MDKRRGSSPFNQTIPEQTERMIAHFEDFQLIIIQVGLSLGLGKALITVLEKIATRFSLEPL